MVRGVSLLLFLSLFPLSLRVMGAVGGNFGRFAPVDRVGDLLQGGPMSSGPMLSRSPAVLDLLGAVHHFVDVAEMLSISSGA